MSVFSDETLPQLGPTQTRRAEIAERFSRNLDLRADRLRSRAREVRVEAGLAAYPDALVVLTVSPPPTSVTVSPLAWKAKQNPDLIAKLTDDALAAGRPHVESEISRQLAEKGLF